MTALGTVQRGTSRPVSFVGKTTASSAGGSITLAQPPGVRAGDFGLILFRAAPTFSAPSGWTQIDTGVYYKVYGESEGSVGLSSTTTKISGSLTVFRGVDADDPVDVSSIKSNSAGTTATTTPVTATVDGVIVNVVKVSGSTGGDTSASIDAGQVLSSAIYQDRRGHVAYGPPIHAGETSKVATWTTAASHTGVVAVQFVLARGGPDE